MLYSALGALEPAALLARTVGAAAVSFLLVLLGGPAVIALLRRWDIGDQTEKGDSAHLDDLHAGKQNTPTMGGILIIAAAIAAICVFAPLGSFHTRLLLATLLGAGAIGSWDDVSKLVTGGRGMRPRTKLVLLTLVGLAIGVATYLHAESTILRVPFMDGTTVPLGLGLIPFAALVFVATTNAVNFTDGLDGLAAGTATIVLLTYTAIALAIGHAPTASLAGLPFAENGGETAVLGAAVVGATLGFLWYNVHPARVFMGDTGSLALGGAITVLALATRRELLLVLVGGVFVLEGLSVVLQISWFKLTRRRLFRIAPIHHHFQFGGLHESQITVRFWIVGAVFSLLSLALTTGG